MPHIGPVELILLLVAVLVVFGPGKLPDLGRGLSEFRQAVGSRPSETKTSHDSASGGNQ